jgi:predicted amidohydrolase YtcJ
MMPGISPHADLVLANGRIYTMDRKRPWASALAVRSGRIVAVGDAEGIKSLIGPETRRIDLAGRMLMPGIVDVHTHMMMGGQAELFELRFSPTASIETVIANVRDKAAKTKAGSWIIGGQWGSDNLAELNRSEMLSALDAASGGCPVMLRDDTYHNRWVNSAALRLAGVTTDMSDPPQGSIGRAPRRVP